MNLTFICLTRRTLPWQYLSGLRCRCVHGGQQHAPRPLRSSGFPADNVQYSKLSQQSLKASGCTWPSSSNMVQDYRGEVRLELQLASVNCSLESMGWDVHVILGTGAQCSAELAPAHRELLEYLHFGQRWTFCSPGRQSTPAISITHRRHVSASHEQDRPQLAFAR